MDTIPFPPPPPPLRPSSKGFVSPMPGTYEEAVAISYGPQYWDEPVPLSARLINIGGIFVICGMIAVLVWEPYGAICFVTAVLLLLVGGFMKLIGK